MAGSDCRGSLSSLTTQIWQGKFMFGLSADKEKVICRALYSGLFFTHFHKSSWWLDRNTELGVKEADWSLRNVLCIESFPFSTYDKSFLSATVYKFNLKHWINSSKILWRWSNFEIYAWKETWEPGLHWQYAKLINFNFLLYLKKDLYFCEGI